MDLKQLAGEGRKGGNRGSCRRVHVPLPTPPNIRADHIPFTKSPWGMALTALHLG